MKKLIFPLLFIALLVVVIYFIYKKIKAGTDVVSKEVKTQASLLFNSTFGFVPYLYYKIQNLTGPSFELGNGSFPTPDKSKASSSSSW